jgi:hypothetical protein
MPRAPRRKPPTPPILPVSYSVAQAVAVTSLSRTLLYQAMAADELKFSLVRKRRIIMREDLEHFIRSKRAPPKAA